MFSNPQILLTYLRLIFIYNKIFFQLIRMLTFTALHIFKVFTWSLASEGYNGEFYVNSNTLCANLHSKTVFVHENRGNTSKHGTSTLLLCAFPRAWLAGCSLVGIPPRHAFAFQSGLEEPNQTLSIIHLTCHYHNHPPTERGHESGPIRAEIPEVWMVWT